MAKRKRHNRKSIPSPFTWRTVEMLQSPGFRALSLTARKILDLLEIELHAGHGGNPFENAKGLPLTYDQIIKALGCDRHAVAAAIREVIALGFVELIREGCAGNAGERQPALYRLTYQHSGSNYLITNEWKRFKTVEEAEAAARQARASTSEPTRVRKNKSPVGETHTGTSGGNPHWKPTNPQWGKPTLEADKSPVGETHTTMRVWEGRRAGAPQAQAPQTKPRRPRNRQTHPAAAPTPPAGELPTDAVDRPLPNFFIDFKAARYSTSEPAGPGEWTT
jgi:hypothetical protein